MGVVGSQDRRPERPGVLVRSGFLDIDRFRERPRCLACRPNREWSSVSYFPIRSGTYGRGTIDN